MDINATIVPSSNISAKISTQKSILGSVNMSSGGRSSFDIHSLDFGTIERQDEIPFYDVSDEGAKKITIDDIIDDVPTQNSDNLVASGGVFDALASKQGIISDLDNIRGGSAAGLTAIQPDTLATLLTTKTDTSVIPNNGGEIKTKYRIAQKGYTEGATWYYPIAKLPADNSGNYASAIINGRIGGWQSNNMSSVYSLIWNRDSTGIALLDIAGTASNMSPIWNTCDIVVYTDSDTTDTIYLKCYNYFTFDIDLELYQGAATILYNGSYITSPSGTLSAQASTSSKRLEIVNGVLKINGVDAATVNDMSDKANDSAVVHLSGAETITGAKTITSGLKVTGRFHGSGDDEGIIVGLASNGYAGICLGDPNGERVVLYNISGSHSAVLRHNVGSTSYDLTFPQKSGMIALTSDIPTTYTGW